jgi:PAS domain S-box-containing protein
MIFRRPLPFMWLLVGQFLLVVAVGMVVVLLLTVYWRLPAAEEQQRAEQRRAASVALLRIEANLELAERRLETLRDALPDLEVWSGALLPDLAVGDEYLALIWVDPQGTVIAVSRQSSQPGAVPLIPRGYDLSRLPVFRDPKHTSRLAWSDQYLSPVSGQPVVALALPTEYGHLLAELSVDRLGDSAAGVRALEGLALLVTDSKGEVVRSPDPQDRLQRRNVRDQTVIDQALRQGAAHGRIQIADSQYEGYAIRMERIGWVVFAGYPLPVANAARHSAFLVTVVTAGVAVAVGLALFSWTARRLQRHLYRSTAYAKAVANGRYPEPPEGSPVKEVAVLEHSLVEMAQRIQQREQQLRAIVDLGPTVAIQVYDRDTRVLDWNPASERILGFSREQAIGKRPVDLFYTAQQQAAFEAILRDIEKTGQAYGPFEGEIRDAHGHTHWIYSTTFPIPGPRPGEPHFVCMDIDITELKRLQEALRELNASLEEKVEHRTRSLQQANAELQHTLQELQRAQAQLVQADKLAALGSLVAGVAHELNTPIGNALMAVSTLGERLRTFQARMAQGLRRSDLDAFVEQVATAEDIAQRNLHRAADLVTSFKQVAVDQTSSQRRTFDLAELVREILLTLQPMLKRAPVTVEVDVPAGIAMDSYPGPLGQVLSNLIQNALVHGLADHPQGHIRVAAEAADGWVTLHVSDDGCGIPPHLHERIFEPFFTTRLGQGGSGLGLHIAHNIVTGMLGGRITFDSEVGRGTTFHIACPLAAPREG